MSRITTLYATHGYDGTKPTWVLLYRTRQATHCIATIPVSAEHAPKRTDRIVNLATANRRGVITTTSYQLEWLD